MTSKSALPPKLQVWIDARKRFKLSHCQIQMARELGLNPKKFGSLANHDQQPWKAPLGEFIEDIYYKRFKREHPDLLLSVEDRFAQENAKRKAKKIEKLASSAQSNE
jgi:hypothetical protein